MGAVLCLVALVSLLGRGPLARFLRIPVRQIVVSGATRVPQAELLAAAGLAVGQSLLELDTEAAERAMASIPWVRSVKVQRRPLATVRVDVEEHEAAALAILGDPYLVSRSGQAFKRVQSPDDLETASGDPLPVLTGMTREYYSANPGEAAERLAGALDLLDQYRHTEGVPEPEEVRLRNESVSIVTRGGTEVRLGADGAAGRIGAYKRINEELKRRGLVATVVHLDRSGRSVAVTLLDSTKRSERRGP